VEKPIDMTKLPGKMVQTPPQIQVGSFKIAFLTDGLWLNDGGCMLGVVPRELWQKEHPPDAKNRIRLNLTCPLIMKGREAVLVDTGIGNRLKDVERKIFGHEDGWLLDGLSALGMEAGDVTHVVLSHLHFDHCGGVVRRRATDTFVAAFPRARYFAQRGEIEVATGAANERLRAAYRHAAECLGPISGMLEAISGDMAVIPGVEALVTGGHTADHQVVLVHDGQEAFIHLADIVPTRSHMKGPWNQAYDLDPITTMERKAHYLERAVARRWWISFAHDDQIFTAHVCKEAGKLKLDDGLTVPREYGLRLEQE
jgi:glyoxylase-like metal-dependent hydrolase (beta-lactamase superfamily II)